MKNESPEHNLMLEVIIQAVRDSISTKQDREEIMAKKNARNWLNSKGRKWGNYQWYCELLGMDPRAARIAVKLAEKKTIQGDFDLREDNKITGMRGQSTIGNCQRCEKEYAMNAGTGRRSPHCPTCRRKVHLKKMQEYRNHGPKSRYAEDIRKAESSEDPNMEYAMHQ